MGEGFNLYLNAIRETRQLEAQRYAMEKVRKQEMAQNLLQALNSVKDLGMQIATDSKLRNQYQTLAKQAGVFEPKQWLDKTERETAITKELEGMTKQQMELIDRIAVLENKIPANGPRDEKQAKEIDGTRRKLDVLKRVLTEKDKEIMEKSNFLNSYRQSPQYQIEFENDAFKNFYKQSPLYSPKYFETMQPSGKADPIELYERKKRIDAQYRTVSNSGDSQKAFSQLKYLNDQYENISRDYAIDDEEKASKQEQIIRQMENILSQPGLSQIDVATGKAIMPSRPKKKDVAGYKVDPALYRSLTVTDIERIKSQARFKGGISAKEIEKAIKGNDLGSPEKVEIIERMINLYNEKKEEKRNREIMQEEFIKSFSK